MVKNGLKAITFRRLGSRKNRGVKCFLVLNQAERRMKRSLSWRDGCEDLGL